tara:strand:- start:1293 stop:1880 length:588 start_codon:yes stop_codon:yes gene_type:complete
MRYSQSLRFLYRIALAVPVFLAAHSSVNFANAEPSTIDAFLGNTVELTVEVEIGDRKSEQQHRFYFTKDGTRILSPAPPGSVEVEDGGTTFGLNEKLCVEHKNRGVDRHFVTCGSFSVTRNLVTLLIDYRAWNTKYVEAVESGKLETVVLADGPGKCRLVSNEQLLTGGDRTNRIYSTTGKCRLMGGRHMTLDEE